ncbi:hypothetical protein BC938DRAFT_479363 [Jimgerdemannia flammicorona]|uniref:HD/PDEase domain-containing protein n=1 Tax=Jimgerdemannia flammicorona TaxID=994334 RepID=A0A433QKZ6_9FUNG|nr:hypothetical protein BC938DRAFT_479363 [Jimgerdemannia flammicorona]
MSPANFIIASSEAFVKTYMAKFDPSHDWLHVDRVRNTALHIARHPTSLQPCDLEVVELAGLFHDVADAKYVSADGPKKTGGEIVTEFLVGLDYDLVKAKIVARVVDNIGFRKELGWKESDDEEVRSWRDGCAELHAVQDADKLDAIGAFGIFRCAAFSGAKNRVLYVPNDKPIEDMTQEQYGEQSRAGAGSAINHFYGTLEALRRLGRA